MTGQAVSFRPAKDKCAGVGNGATAPAQLSLAWDRLQASTGHGIQPAHREALKNPAPGFEQAIVGMLRSLAQYADAHRQRYADGIRQDRIIGEYWHWLGEAVIGLLNGETGRLDCGTLDGWIRGLIDSDAGPAETRAFLDELAPDSAAPLAAPKARAARSKAAPPDVPASAIGIRTLNARQRELVGMVAVVDNVANYTDAGHIDDWSELKSTMLALGGKWRSKKGFVFPDDIDAAERVRLAVATGEVLDPRAASFFPTPAWLADELVKRAGVTDEDNVLEPSAGTGALALAVRRVAPKAHIVCVEALPDNVATLRALGFQTNECDFLKSESPGGFTRVVMNPPFEGRADIKHVTRAFELLATGGVLAAIMSSGVAHRQDRLATEFRALVTANGGEIIENADGAFLESGTGVRTVTVVMRRPS